MIRLTALRLSRFRSYRRAEFALDGRPVSIFGPNGAGKTSILEAVSLISPGRGLRRARAEEMSGRPDPIGWKVWVELSVAGSSHEIETWSEGGASRSVRIDGKTASQTAMGRLVQVLWLVPAMDRLWTEGADGRRRFVDRVALGFDPGHGEATLAYEKARRDRNRLLKDGSRDDSWFAALEAQMAEAGARIAEGREFALSRIAAAQERASPEFPAAELAIDPLDGGWSGGADGLRDALAAGRGRDFAAGRTLVGPHRHDLDARYVAKDVPARDCSTGEQKALLISLVLANARALAAMTGHAPILLLDEVAAHLDKNRQRALHDAIAELGAQALMTGTGPELFADLGDRTQRVRVSETAGLSLAEAA